MDTYKVKLTNDGVIQEFTKQYYHSDITFYINIWRSLGYGIDVERLD
jgi:hypothetical protein